MIDLKHQKPQTLFILALLGDVQLYADQLSGPAKAITNDLRSDLQPAHLGVSRYAPEFEIQEGAVAVQSALSRLV